MAREFQSPTDSASVDVYPVHMFDDYKGPRSIMMQWIFRVDAQLDASKLRSALTRVLETGDWRKLAGRLHCTVCITGGLVLLQHADLEWQKTGGLEIHVPHTFTDQDPAFTYTHRDYSTETFDDDAKRRAFPKADSGPQVYARTPSANESVFAPGTPKTLQEHMERGLPQLGLHISTFKDVTLIELTWPHTVMDGTGQRELLAAWSLALADREHEIKPLAGAREDVAWHIAGQYTDEQIYPNVVRDRELTGFRKLFFFCRLFWRHLTGPRADWRIFYLPKPVIRTWREDVFQLPTGSKTDEHPFVSDGDLICAWLVSLAAVGRHPSTRYVIAGSFNCRARIPALRDAPGVYMQNLLGLYFASITPDDVAGPSSSLARIALAHRAEVAAQTTESQVLHHFQRRRNAAETQREPGMPFYCRSDEVPVLCNNLAGLRIGAAADFGPAVVVAGTGGPVASGRVVSHHYLSTDDKNRPVPYFICLDQDEGGYWIRGNASAQTWDKIIREIGTVDADV
ncbi:alpha/beta hydrolase fold-3 [Akanthomyces lecanii RCEF 1005]|uniref:Alpha/beta hydrolase fold-3 n=1 Tax=Akanthomyces lecanii RCEF 1005 TaxID=1081108 RepID=A0A168FBS1_CORDF|nr:alpha/beta hydrolase fold-3 [Akanthomyces lecanii RCEF 1005]